MKLPKDIVDDSVTENMHFMYMYFTLNVPSRNILYRSDQEKCSSFAELFFFELFPDNSTINSEVYCHQLDKSCDSTKENRPEFVN